MYECENTCMLVVPVQLDKFERKIFVRWIELLKKKTKIKFGKIMWFIWLKRKIKDFSERCNFIGNTRHFWHIEAKLGHSYNKVLLKQIMPTTGKGHNHASTRY